jgi:hypothetical protein
MRERGRGAGMSVVRGIIAMNRAGLAETDLLGWRGPERSGPLGEMLRRRGILILQKQMCMRDAGM